MSTKSRSQQGSARVKRLERNQIEMRYLSLDQVIEPGHRGHKPADCWGEPTCN